MLRCIIHLFFLGSDQVSNAVYRPLRVFLCHATGDKPTVRQLYQRLHREGWIDAWLDEEKLLAGQAWDTEIEKAVETADAVIVCLSKKSVSKEGYIQRELKYVLDIALDKPEDSIFIIPLRLGELEVPRQLRRWQSLDFFPTQRRDTAFQRLLASLRKRADQLGIFIVKSGIDPKPSVRPLKAADNEPIKNGITASSTNQPQETESKLSFWDLVKVYIPFLFAVPVLILSFIYESDLWSSWVVRGSVMDPRIWADF